MNVLEYDRVGSIEECSNIRIGSAKAASTISVPDFSLNWFVVPSDEEISVEILPCGRECVENQVNCHMFVADRI